MNVLPLPCVFPHLWYDVLTVKAVPGRVAAGQGESRRGEPGSGTVRLHKAREGAAQLSRSFVCVA